MDTPTTIDLVITSLGARGDGIAQSDGRRVFVPGALPGERVRVQIWREMSEGLHATALTYHSRAPDRAEPPCPHFGACGGCAAQHLPAKTYAKWKTDLIRQALAHRGLSGASFAPPIMVKPGIRRRARLAGAAQDGKIVVGFRAMNSRRIIDVAHCPLLAPKLARLMTPLRQLMTEAKRKLIPLEISLTEASTGVDMLLLGKLALDVGMRERLAAFADTQDLARLSVQSPSAPPEIVVERRPVLKRFGDVQVRLPVGAFLQPTAEGESAIVGATCASVGDAGRVADLYAGCGTVALSLTSAGVKVHAVEQDREMCAAIATAVAGTNANVTIEQRDLARAPLREDELGCFEAVVFDPPRAGARQQSALLAKSRVPIVVAISCNPATFARDARTLVDGGYRLMRIVPLDQFLWSSHMELIATFGR